jgi:hypothetical protein
MKRLRKKTELTFSLTPGISISSSIYKQTTKLSKKEEGFRLGQYELIWRYMDVICLYPQ